MVPVPLLPAVRTSNPLPGVPRQEGTGTEEGAEYGVNQAEKLG